MLEIMGLANEVEGGSDTGTITYTSTYNPLALDMVGDCVDTDGDGILDNVDVDDDNDGIVDAIECSSASSIVTEISGTASLDAVPAIRWLAIPNTDPLSDATSANGATPDLLEGTTIQTANFNLHVVPSPEGGAVISGLKSSTFDEGVRTIVTTTIGTEYTISFYQTIVSIQNIADNSILDDNGDGHWQVYQGLNLIGESAVISNTGDPTGAIYPDNSWSLVEMTFTATAPATELSFFPEIDNGSTGSRLGMDGLIIKDSAAPLCDDTDGDGIINSLDLDSDDDGCSDAVEAGVPTANLSVGNNAGTANVDLANAFFNPSVDVGTNGLADELEDTNDSGGINYISRYSTLALDDTLDGCLFSLDTDGDGIVDEVDIDDDNDGVLDTDECDRIIQSAGLIDNGSLEGPTAAPSTINSTTPPGWDQLGTTTTDTVDENLTYISSSFFPSNDGGTFIRAHTRGELEPSEGIQQTIDNLVIGQQYTLFFEQTISNQSSPSLLAHGGFWTVTFWK